MGDLSEEEMREIDDLVTHFGEPRPCVLAKIALAEVWVLRATLDRYEEAEERLRTERNDHAREAERLSMVLDEVLKRSSPPSTGVVLTEGEREALRWLYSSLYGGVAGRSVLMIRGDARSVLDRLLAAPAGGQGER